MNLYKLKKIVIDELDRITDVNNYLNILNIVLNNTGINWPLVNKNTILNENDFKCALVKIEEAFGKKLYFN